MIIVTGFGVMPLIFSSSAGPHTASLVSTSVTPASVMNTETLPPLNVAALPGVDEVITKRLSFSFTTSSCAAVGVGAGVCGA